MSRPPLFSRDALAATCLAALALTVVPFAAKYGAEQLALTRAVATAVGVVLAVAYAGGVWTVRRRTAARPWLADSVAAVAVGAAVVLAYVAPAETAVVRSPAVAGWLGALADGRFPYGIAERPSGLPGLFAILAPFWASGALWLVAPAGVALTWVAARAAVPERDRLAVALAFVALPAVWYEVVVRSELVFNGALVVLAALVGDRALRRGGLAVGTAAVLGGVVVSTRLTAGAVLVAVGGVWLRRAPRRAVLYGAVAAAVLAATLVPFVLWDPERFAAAGPFAIQSLYLPTAAKGALAAASLAVGARARSVPGALVGAGLVVWSGAALWLAVRVADVGWALAIWNDGFDLGYLALGVPMLLLGLVSRAPAGG